MRLHSGGGGVGRVIIGGLSANEIFLGEGAYNREAYFYGISIFWDTHLAVHLPVLIGTCK